MTRKVAIGMIALVIAAPASAQTGAPGGEGGATPARAELQYQSRLASRSRGSGPVTVYELIDFQCPHCRQFALETYPKVESRYVRTGKLRWVLLYVPRPQHTNAVRAGEVGMCAARAGKFWEASDRIMEGQAVWEDVPQPDSVLYRLVAGVGLDARAVESCVRRGVGRSDIAADAALLAAAGLANQGVPSFVVDGRVIARGALPFTQLTAVLDSVLTARGR